MPAVHRAGVFGTFRQSSRSLSSRPEIAALMNQWFINVKVDREQLPDVDRIYMLAVFLTPDLSDTR